MTITPEKYVRKPLVVLGVEVTKSNFTELALWLQGSIQNKDGSEPAAIDPDTQYIMVRVHNPKSPRQSRAFVGDWILYSDRGYKVYTPKAFKNTFDRLSENGREREEPKETTEKAELIYVEQEEHVKGIRVDTQEEPGQTIREQLVKKRDEATRAEEDDEEYVHYLDEKEKNEADGE